MTLQATAQRFAATRVAGFGTWKTLGRSVVKGSTGLAVLAPCTYTPKDTGTDQAVPPAAATVTGTAREPAGVDADRPAQGRVLRGFRIAHVFDISQTEGDPLPDVIPELLCGDAPAVLWDALAAQVAAHGYSLTAAGEVAGARALLEDLGAADGVDDDVGAEAAGGRREGPRLVTQPQHTIGLREFCDEPLRASGANDVRGRQRA
jgi:hypothetical protein